MYAFSLTILYSITGQEYPAVVEFAPFQKTAKKRSKKKDAKCGTIVEGKSLMLQHGIHKKNLYSFNIKRAYHYWSVKHITHLWYLKQRLTWSSQKQPSIVFCMLSHVVCHLDPEYKKFLENYNGDEEKLTSTPETLLEELEAKSKELVGQCSALFNEQAHLTHECTHFRSDFELSGVF